VKTLDKRIPNSANRVYWNKEKKRYFSPRNFRHGKKRNSTREVRKDVVLLEEDFPPLGNPTIEEDICQEDIGEERDETDIPEQVAMYKHHNLMTPVAPEGMEWCVACVPVTYMTPMGPMIVLEEKFILVHLA